MLLLNEVQRLVENSKHLGSQDEEFVKSAFKKILGNGDVYTVAELENLFLSQANAAEQSVIDRVMNIAHYQKSKFDASNKFRMISDGNECACGGSP